MKNKNVAFVAGGTGGHINAALAMGEAFEKISYNPFYITGMRPLDYKLYPPQETFYLPAVALRSKFFFSFIINFFKNINAFIKAFTILSKKKPLFVFGSGGYVCGPVCLAAYFLRIPVFILEQNSVMGLTNKILAKFSKKVFVHFKQTQGMKKIVPVVVGNPIRSSIKEKLLNLDSSPSATFNVLVFGGSLGAMEINNLILKYIEEDSDVPLFIKHQTGPAFIPPLKIGKNIQYEAVAYIEHIEQEYAKAQFILCRAGASSLAELRYVKKPVLLVPYLKATDDHQTKNAQLFQKEESFPVYIASVTELLQNDCRELKNFIQQAKLAKQDERNVSEDSAMLIIKEIKKYVSI